MCIRDRVYTSQSPSEAPALLKYGEMWIGNAGFGCPGTRLALLRWEFPLFTPKSAISFSFGACSIGNCGCDPCNLLTTPASPKQSLSGNSFRLRPSEFSNVPTGYCFNFHKGGHCAGCSFKHSCPKCECAHLMSICTFGPHSKQLPRTTANGKSSGAKSSPPNANKVQ